MKYLKSIPTKAIICYLLLSTVACATEQNEIDTNRGLKVIELDDCQYWYREGLLGYSYLAHKGNCKNPIHDCR